MAICRSCSSEFVPTPHQVSRRNFLCKTCWNQYKREWRCKRREQGFSTNGSTVWDEKKKAAWKERYYASPAVRQRKAQQMRGYAHDERLKSRHQARLMVHHAIESGALHREACVCCGCQETQAHHKDYSKPLEIIWVCRSCHQKIHAKGES